MADRAAKIQNHISSFCDSAWNFCISFAKKPDKPPSGDAGVHQEKTSDCVFKLDKLLESMLQELSLRKVALADVRPV